LLKRFDPSQALKVQIVQQLLDEGHTEECADFQVYDGGTFCICHKED
jgi:hypothetical protein